MECAAAALRRDGLQRTCPRDEGVWIVDEMNNRMRANMENVLRAMDVIPPFDPHSVSVGSDSGPEPMVSPAPPERVVPTPELTIGKPTPRPNEEVVPTLDLGEKILAEQRRRTARTRKAPGSQESSTTPEPQRETLSTEDAVGATTGLTELQELVSDIVARDIARLYAGVERSSYRATGS